MPKGFIDGKPILTKEEFVEFFFTSRGYEKNSNGEWELISSELCEITQPKAITKTKSISTKSTAKTNIVKQTTSVFSKDKVIENINQLLTENDYNFSAEKATFLITLKSENYEMKIVRKTIAFEFDENFTSVKDIGKQKIIKTLLTLTFCTVGVIDAKGTVGFTNGNEYITATITKKRK